ncbi:hypothetical protein CHINAEXTREME_13200 [Halobiforma lacisalsi AJ5]|uniref:Uncharacterized protein n=1 Tax=Natronobacterium lacisalsi AJ5 TaxID=358396 RepID=M0LG25_NATLA|nr:hypothetical protein [Halobiforma lacisalsi]APW98676.1 hypothetical protein CHINAEXTREME_13200 [Halobiforma lacisalsi AJ5]EMA32547.1 hypothetical protein C445_10537 [Halobiforma lacisalsi AJ5]
MSLERDSSRSTPAVLGECAGRTDTRSCLCEIQYEIDHGLVDHRPEHEGWLFDWCLECLEVEAVKDVTVDRRESDRRTTVTLQIEVDGECWSTFSDEEFIPLLERLEGWVGEFQVRCTTTG